MPVRAFIFMLLAALALAGCGRLGPLEAPPGKAAVAVPAADATQTTTIGTGVSSLDPGSGTLSITGASGPTASTEEAQPAAPPKKRFFLDFLL